jgi:cytoskeletal protein RodZ
MYIRDKGEEQFCQQQKIALFAVFLRVVIMGLIRLIALARERAKSLPNVHDIKQDPLEVSNKLNSILNSGDSKPEETVDEALFKSAPVCKGSFSSTAKNDHGGSLLEIRVDGAPSQSACQVPSHGTASVHTSDNDALNVTTVSHSTGLASAKECSVTGGTSPLKFSFASEDFSSTETVQASGSVGVEPSAPELSNVLTRNGKANSARMAKMLLMIEEAKRAEDDRLQYESREMARHPYTPKPRLVPATGQRYQRQYRRVL